MVFSPLSRKEESTQTSFYWTRWLLMLDLLYLLYSYIYYMHSVYKRTSVQYICLLKGIRYYFVSLETFRYTKSELVAIYDL